MIYINPLIFSKICNSISTKNPYFIASPLYWLENEVSPPLSWAFSRFRFFFCTHKYKPLLKQILWQKAQQIWNLETMWNLQSYYLQFPWSAHSCLWRTSPGTSATGESHQHRSEISVKAQLVFKKWQENSLQEKIGSKRIVLKIPQFLLI